MSRAGAERRKPVAAKMIERLGGDFYLSVNNMSELPIQSSSQCIIVSGFEFKLRLPIMPGSRSSAGPNVLGPSCTKKRIEKCVLP
jgi:hypothetical protein